MEARLNIRFDSTLRMVIANSIQDEWSQVRSDNIARVEENSHLTQAAFSRPARFKNLAGQNPVFNDKLQFKAITLFSPIFLNNYNDGVIDVFANRVYQSACLV